jgi:MFS family permease
LFFNGVGPPFRILRIDANSQRTARGWSEGIGGLAFVGVAVGMIIGCVYSIVDDKRYRRTTVGHKGFVEPEQRLPSVMVGAIAIPVGMFWFAFTNSPSFHWAVSVAAGSGFGFGMVLVYLGIMNYLIDAYTIFAASALAGNVVLRSLFGTIFPLFTDYMYAHLGIHWASAVPAFLALLCLPMPFVFYKYGPIIRSRCKFGAESARLSHRLEYPS